MYPRRRDYLYDMLSQKFPLTEQEKSLPENCKSFNKLSCPKCDNVTTANAITGFLKGFFVYFWGCSKCGVQVQYRTKFDESINNIAIARMEYELKAYNQVYARLRSDEIISNNLLRIGFDEQERNP